MHLVIGGTQDAVRARCDVIAVTHDAIRAGELADPDLWDNTAKEFEGLAKSDEDLLLAVLFPMQARDFLEQRG